MITAHSTYRFQSSFHYSLHSISTTSPAIFGLSVSPTIILWSCFVTARSAFPLQFPPISTTIAAISSPLEHVGAHPDPLDQTSPPAISAHFGAVASETEPAAGRSGSRAESGPAGSRGRIAAGAGPQRYAQQVGRLGACTPLSPHQQCACVCSARARMRVRDGVWGWASQR